MNLPIELINHILSYRHTHPIAHLIKNIHPIAYIIKQKYKEYYNYRLPGCCIPVVELDKNGNKQVFSAPLIRDCDSFYYNGEYNVSFSEWFLYFVPNVKELYWNEYQYW